MGKLARLPALGRAPEAADADARRIPRLQTRYYAFLSYSHKDKELADWLHRELERFRVPRSLVGRLTANGVVPKRLTPIFRDQHDLAATGDLGGEIKTTLAVSQFLIVLCSPTAAVSRWTNAEIEWFKQTHPDGCVLAAVASGEPFAGEMPGREDEECFPPALKYKYDRRGHRSAKRAEPLAADLRGSDESRRVGFLKLVAGMLGVGLDELVQREQTRRHRRMAWLAAASVAGMALTSTLSVFAIQSRNEAREQRREAEGLVEFMVGDLRNKLEPIGKLDVLDGVGSRVLAYYSKQDTSQLSDAALVQRSQALNLMAEVAFNRGNLQQAEGLYRQAMSGTAEAVRRSPGDPQRIFDHAQNVFYVGEVARFAGRPSEAEAQWREYKRLADQMSALAPDNLRYRMEVLYANEDIGISLYNQHRFGEADQLFTGVLGPMEKLVSLYPDDASYQKEFATVLAWIADARRSGGNLKAAIGARERQISVLNQLVEKAADSDARSRLIKAHEGLGLALAESGQYGRAVEELNSAIGEALDLIPIEPHNALWKSSAADAELSLGQVLTSLGRRDEAARQTLAGCALTAGLPAGLARTRLETNCTMNRARLELAAGATEQALSLAERALPSARAEHGEDTILDRYRTAQVYLLLGDVHQRNGDSQDAKVAWNVGLTMLPSNVNERPLEMDVRAGLLRRVGRTNEVVPLVNRLNAIGYRSLI